MPRKRRPRMTQPWLHVYFAALALFAVVSTFWSLWLAGVEIVVALVLYALFFYNQRLRGKEFLKYIDSVTGSMGEAAKDSMANSPLPIVILHPETGEVVWSNEKFLALAPSEQLFGHGQSIRAPDFQTRWLMEGKTECPGEVALCNRTFRVYGHLMRAGQRGRGNLFATTYWLNITDLADARDRYIGSRPVISVLLLDNYEDVMKNISDTARAAMTSAIERRLADWTESTGGLFCRVNRDRFVFVFERQYLQGFIDQKFSILDAIREVRSPGDMACTLSIGIGVDAPGLAELFQYANLSIEMALSRGGDQVVIKNQFTFEFFGGRARETEKRTKVKSRVMASALAALARDSDTIFVMGHKQPDLDAVGAAAGVCAIARKLGKPAYVVCKDGQPPAGVILDRLAATPEYEAVMISEQDAIVYAGSRSLLVVVDTNRPDQVQSEELLESCNKVAVIDHHRRAADYIENAALNFHEPYASSASELVTELLQYMAEPGDLLRVEAEALLAGIVLDTKNFTMRTGARTFEAAAFLRRAGADSYEVKKLFQNDLDGTISRYGIIQNARMYRGDIAIARAEHAVSRVTAAQAADELLNISGVEASFVLYPEGDRVVISARSIGQTNVQVVLEGLGGGGNASAAGAQVAGTPDEVSLRLTHAIDAYFAQD